MCEWDPDYEVSFGKHRKSCNKNLRNGGNSGKNMENSQTGEYTSMEKWKSLYYLEKKLWQFWKAAWVLDSLSLLD